MGKIGNILLKSIVFIFTIILSWIIILATFLGEPVIFKFNPLLLIIGVTLYIIVISVIYKKLIPKIQNYNWLPIVLLLVFMVITVIVSYNLRLNPTWDMGTVFTIAKDYVTSKTAYFEYLYKYPNNVAITGIFFVILKIASLFKITETLSYINIITFANAIIVSLTVTCLYYAVKKLFGKDKALLVLIISLLTTPFYLYAAIYYTDTMAMFLSTFLLLLWAIIKDYKPKENSKIDKVKKLFLNIIFGITIALGIKLKITSIFIIIAIVVESILNGNTKIFIKRFGTAIITSIITFIIFTIGINKYVLPNEDYTDKYKMPIEYWLLIGSIGNGGFSGEESEKLSNIETYSKRQEIARQELKDVLKEYDFKGFMKHINQKLKWAWGDGTYLAPEKLYRQPIERTAIYEYVSRDGKSVEKYKYFPQIMHISMLILMLLSAIYSIRNKKYESDEIVLYIAIFGLIVFFLIWENRSRYILPLLPIMLILEVKGIEAIINPKSKLLLNNGKH